jgi:hypothetical protein
MGRNAVLVFGDFVVHSRAVPLSYNQDCNRYRDGVQVSILAHGDITVDRESDVGWNKVPVHFTPAEARQLAAQLVAAADSHDRVCQDDYVMRRLEKIARHVGADIFGAWAVDDDEIRADGSGGLKAVSTVPARGNPCLGDPRSQHPMVDGGRYLARIPGAIFQNLVPPHPGFPLKFDQQAARDVDQTNDQLEMAVGLGEVLPNTGSHELDTVRGITPLAYDVDCSAVKTLVLLHHRSLP